MRREHFDLSDSGDGIGANGGPASPYSAPAPAPAPAPASAPASPPASSPPSSPPASSDGSASAPAPAPAPADGSNASPPASQPADARQSPASKRALTGQNLRLLQYRRQLLHLHPRPLQLRYRHLHRPSTTARPATATRSSRLPDRSSIRPGRPTLPTARRRRSAIPRATTTSCPARSSRATATRATTIRRRPGSPSPPRRRCPTTAPTCPRIRTTIPLCLVSRPRRAKPRLTLSGYAKAHPAWNGATDTTDGSASSVVATYPSLGGVYTGNFVGVILAALQSNPDVASVASDDDVFVAGGPAAPAMALQANPPWHLSRISNRAALPAKNFPPLHYNATAGQGVDVRPLAPDSADVAGLHDGHGLPERSQGAQRPSFEPASFPQVARVRYDELSFH